jgi:4-amino-4-deoxy-L-arabinose transferase-like glycosyltransferase
VSARDHASQPARPVLDVPQRLSQAPPLAVGRRGAFAGSRIHVSRWSAYVWGAIAATSTFIAFTCWWLTQDRSIPIYDAGAHLETAIEYHNMIAAGNLLGPLKSVTVYPILAHIVGAVAMFVGGVNLASPIVGENLIFIPMLALGCYQTGRLLFGKLAGLLAVLFVLGSPLVISMFHVFMLDGPLTAIVAVSIWLLLASEDFSRPGMSAWAGLAVGIGFNVKSQFAQFLIGLVLILLLHGGWRNWRGFAIFCVVVIMVGSPWYLVHFSELGYMLEVAGSASVAPPGNAPPLLSVVNFTWYFWSVLNSQVLAPLFILVLAGAAWTIRAVARSRGTQAQRLELLGATFLAWLVVTLTDHHDPRYGLPLLPFVAVIATGWIVCVRPPARVAAIALLALAVAANTLAITFGVGGEAKIALQAHLPGSEELPDRIVFYSTTGFLAAGPRRDGDVPGLLDALHREGVRTVSWSLEQTSQADFSFEGLGPLARFAKLTAAFTETPQFSRSSSVATLIHEPVSSSSPPPCTRVSNIRAGTVWITGDSVGAGVWVVRYDPAARKLALYCPSRRPQYYDIGAVG